MSFRIAISGGWSLAIDEIWPDGNAPEDPTIEDVRAVVPDVQTLIAEWNLIPEVDVY